MCFSAANFRPLLLLLSLALAGSALRSVESLIARPPAWHREQAVALAGRGSLPAVLGGLRSVAAGGFWLRTNLAWERRDAAATAAWIELTVAADERPAYFWLNGARMLAYDVPGWLSEAAPSAVRQRVNEEQARRALRFLEQGLRWHGAAADLYVEMANIHLRRRNDGEEAARCYRLAAAQPDAPYYAARIHAELLHRLGRPEEALKWLRAVLPDLPADEPLACRAVVEARIGALERELAGR